MGNLKRYYATGQCVGKWVSLDGKSYDLMLSNPAVFLQDQNLSLAAKGFLCCIAFLSEGFNGNIPPDIVNELVRSDHLVEVAQ